MTQSAKQHFNQSSGILALWFGVLSGPIIWIVDQQVKYMVLTYICSSVGLMLLHLVTMVSLLVVATGVSVSWRTWQQVRQEPVKGSVIARTRFMAVLGILFGGLFSLLVIAQWLPSFFFNPCQR